VSTHFDRENDLLLWLVPVGALQVWGHRCFLMAVRSTGPTHGRAYDAGLPAMGLALGR
jgi:hypothetical protein